MTRSFAAGLAAALSSLAIAVTPAHAGSVTDGAAGPWADAVVAFAQGNTVAGRQPAVPRRDGRAALGRAEASAVDGSFASLGFGGVLVLVFANPVCDRAGPDLHVAEVTRGGGAMERAQVDVSADGSTWTSALRLATGATDGELPDRAGAVRFVRITDVTDPVGFRANADGFDVDGLAALHPVGPCPPGVDGDDVSLLQPAGTPRPVPAARTPAPSGRIGIAGVPSDLCRSKRRFEIRLRVPAGFSPRLRSVRVRVAGRRVPVRYRRGRYRATVDLRGLARDRYTIAVRMVDRTGRVARDTRRYRTCTPGSR